MSAARVIAGFALAPLVPSSVMAIMSGEVVHLPSFVIGLAPYTYLATAVFGIPAFFVFRRFRLVRLRHYLIGGFLGPVACFLVIAVFDRYTPLLQWLRTGTLFGTITAPATGLFWLIAVRQPKT